MRGLLIFVFAFLYSIGLIYLFQPAPSVAPLPQALRSDEPGDTWQNPDQSAYFTDLSREEVIAFYQDSFGLDLFGLRLRPFRLNYRPEDTAIYVRKHIDSYYLEELVFPFRDSLFVHGWNPSLAPQNRDLPELERAKRLININGQPFSAKIILKPYYSPLWARLLVWTLVFPVGYLVLTQFFTSLNLLFRAVKSRA